jgi:hypothetical protein
MLKKRLVALTTTFSLLVLIYAIYSLSANPAKGYELSIYSATPKVFWVAIIIGLINGIFLIIYSIIGKSKRTWVIGVFEVLLCNFMIISLYALRGYTLYFGRGDVGSYVGLAKDVISNGYLSINNFYPIVSIIVSQIAQISSISPISICQYMPALFFVFYFVSSYCWAKSISKEKKFILSVLLAATPIFFAWFPTSIYHQMLSIWTLPFFFFCVQKNHELRYRIICIVMCISYPFWHPLTAVMVCLYLFTWSSLEKLGYIKNEKMDKTNRNVSLTLILICFVSMIAWFISQYPLVISMRSIVLQLLGLLDKTSTFLEVTELSSKIGLLSAVKTAFLMITDDMVYYILSLFSIYCILFKPSGMIRKKYLPIIMCFIMGNIFYLIIFLATRTHTPDRLINLNINMIFTPLLVGYLLFRLSHKKRRAKYTFILFFLFISLCTSISSLYPSPITMRPNDQVTKMDVVGMKWLIDNKNHEHMTGYVMTSPHRFSDLIYGCSFKQERADLRKRGNLYFPDHFGIENDSFFPVDRISYFTISDFDIRAYTEVWDDMDRFTKEDFNKINVCNNIDKIYENGELRNLLIYD